MSAPYPAGDVEKLARLLAAYGLVSGGDTRPLAEKLHSDYVRPLLAAKEREALAAVLDALADCVVKATEYGTQDGGFVAYYISPTGPIHRAIPLLERHGIAVRPGFDGRPKPEGETP